MAPETRPACCPVRLFYSYSQKDEELAQTLDKHLTTLRRLGWIRDWHRGRVSPGRPVEAEARRELADADIVLLLLSADFMAEDALMEGDAANALARHRIGTMRVIPIRLRPVDLEGTEIDELSSLPSNGRPVSDWDNKDSAFTDIAGGVRTAIRNLGQAPKNLGHGNASDTQIYLCSELFQFVHTDRVSLAHTSAQVLESIIKDVKLPRLFMHSDRVGIRFEYELLHEGQILPPTRPIAESGVRSGSILHLRTRTAWESSVPPIESNSDGAVFLGSEDRDKDFEPIRELGRTLKRIGW